MIHFDSRLYSKRVYARFRSSLALERFIQDPFTSRRASSVKWAKAWLLAVHVEEGHGQDRRRWWCSTRQHACTDRMHGGRTPFLSDRSMSFDMPVDGFNSCSFLIATGQVLGPPTPHWCCHVWAGESRFFVRSVG